MTGDFGTAALLHREVYARTRISDPAVAAQSEQLMLINFSKRLVWDGAKTSTPEQWPKSAADISEDYRVSIETFQGDHGLERTGKLDYMTLRAGARHAPGPYIYNRVEITGSGGAYARVMKAIGPTFQQLQSNVEQGNLSDAAAQAAQLQRFAQDVEGVGGTAAQAAATAAVKSNAATVERAAAVNDKTAADRQELHGVPQCIAPAVARW